MRSRDCPHQERMVSILSEKHIFLISTAVLFLAAKSEETPCPLNNDWFEQYRERVIDAENIILRTLDFELNVEHPYDPLTSVLNKLGLSQTDLHKNSVLTL
ncbi:hypothetical protein C5167_043482 [Papaver somniferum]|uniref:Cyclin N-terminal domain-containing protein n=1 Tax=Papaver somniferum TaxID=3469 RepID=A0A4Y7L7H9_PAPSO|nr:hypothetical protein C5167_043482 [Papaver somniferum]